MKWLSPVSMFLLGTLLGYLLSRLELGIRVTRSYRDLLINSAERQARRQEDERVHGRW